MRDSISAERVNLLHPKVITEVINGINKAEGLLGEYACIRIVQGYRTMSEQATLYAQGRTTPGAIVTNSKPGSSFHNYGLAIDFAIMYDKDKNGTFETLSWDILVDMNKDGESDWKTVVDTFKSLGGSWGGDWKSLKDNPHLERNFGMNWRDCLYRYTNKIWYLNTKFIRV